MNIADILLVLLLTAILFFAVRTLVRRRQAGCSCSSCGGGSCSSCGASRTYTSGSAHTGRSTSPSGNERSAGSTHCPACCKEQNQEN